MVKETLKGPESNYHPVCPAPACNRFAFWGMSYDRSASGSNPRLFNEGFGRYAASIYFQGIRNCLDGAKVRQRTFGLQKSVSSTGPGSILFPVPHGRERSPGTVANAGSRGGVNNKKTQISHPERHAGKFCYRALPFMDHNAVGVAGAIVCNTPGNRDQPSLCR